MAGAGRCERLCVVRGAGRWSYLIGGTLLMLGFVVEMICLGIIITPYLGEHQFTQASCRFVASAYRGGDQFCQDVFDRDPSSFPCLTVRVAFTAVAAAAPAMQQQQQQQQPAGTSGLATLYLLYSYYTEATLPAKCTSRICYKDKLLNAQQVAKLNVTLYNKGQNFTCYIRQETDGAEYSALYGREFSHSQVFHCILWPVLACGCGLMLIWLVFCIAGCRVWGNGMGL